MQKEPRWTSEETQILIDNYQTHNCTQIGEMIGKSKSSVETKAFRLKLKKSPEWYTNPNSKRFVKGHTKRDGYKPHNKGKKRSEWLPQDKIEKVQQTQFKKGHKPDHSAEVGTIVTRIGQLRKTYQWIKIDEKNWIFLHHKIWIDAYGQIPDDYLVAFIDGNTMNVNINNLKLISKTDHMNRNRDSQYPEELKQLIRANNKLKKEVWQRTKSRI